MRLADGLDANEGRVEVCVYEQWATVCDENWGMAEARVVCNQLGLVSESEPIAHHIYSLFYTTSALNYYNIIQMPMHYMHIKTGLQQAVVSNSFATDPSRCFLTAVMTSLIQEHYVLMLV